MVIKCWLIISVLKFKMVNFDKELEYNDVENTKEYNKKIIQLIDEPLIHYQLKELYMQYVNDDDYLQEEIDRLTKLKSK